jgi:putative membrane-bound dehydrogenase-like protein
MTSRRFSRACFLAAFLALAVFASFSSAASPLRFKLAETFTAAAAADEGVLRFPVFATFDDAGRLYVAESSGGDLYSEIRALTPGYRVTRLEDLDGDGFFEHAQVFADHLAVIMGIAWRDGWLYLTQGPEVAALRDADGDGLADEKRTILHGFGHQTNGGLHGLIFGPDDRLYMTVGQPDGYRFRDARGEEVWGRTGALIRCKADGAEPEVLARGFENLMEIVFLPTGEIIGANNWIQLPSDGVRDALVQIVEGGLYPHMKDDGSPLPRTGRVLPSLERFPAVSFSGLARYRGGNFPAEFHGRLFSAQFNTRAVQWHSLTREGAAFTVQSKDFLSSDDPDFRPSDVLEAPDGSLLVVHTGSWYVQHCPTGGVAASGARGGLLRISARHPTDKRDAPGAALDALWKAGTDELLRLLDGAAWERAALACRILGARRDRAASHAVAGLLSSPHAPLRLAAAEALAACGAPEAVPAIFDAIARETDPFVEHTLVAALLRLGSERAFREALGSKAASVRRAAWIALDQAPHSSLTPADVISALDGDGGALRETVLETLARHPEWAAEALPTVKSVLLQPSEDPEALAKAAGLVRTFAASNGIRRLLASMIEDHAAPENQRRFAIRIAAAQRGEEFPAEWAEAIDRVLRQETPSSLRLAAIEVAVALQSAAWDASLAAIALDAAALDAERLAAWRALAPRVQPALARKAVDFLTQYIQSDSSGARRIAAAQILQQLPLTDSDRENLRELAKSDPLINGLFPTDAPPGRPGIDLSAFEPLLDGGDPLRGEALFFGAATCSACHKVAGRGGKLGPDLTKIGRIRAGRDLLESLLSPSATFAQGWHPVIVHLSDGGSHHGTLARELAASIVVRDAAGIERPFEKSRVQRIERLSTSTMPSGFERLLSREDLAHLLAYLKHLR